jgi:hypothetical protein
MSYKFCTIISLLQNQKRRATENKETTHTTEKSSGEENSSSESEESDSQETSKSNNNKVCCVFCIQNTFNIEEHLKINHMNEASIQKLFNLNKNSIEKKILLQNIIGSNNVKTKKVKKKRNKKEEKSNSVNNIYYSRSLCKYCSKTKWVLVEHLISKHSNEPEVKQFMKFPVHSKERKALLRKIRAEAVYKNNLKVQKTGKGNFMPTYQDQAKLLKRKIKSNAYVPCQYCSKFITKHNFSTHIQRCESIFKNIENKTNKV